MGPNYSLLHLATYFGSEVGYFMLIMNTANTNYRVLLNFLLVRSGLIPTSLMARATHLFTFVQSEI